MYDKRDYEGVINLKIRKQLITITTLVVAICVLINYVGVDTQANYDMIYTDFIAMDEEGNVEIFTEEEVETPDEEAIAEIAIEEESDATLTIFETALNMISSIFSLPSIQVEVSATTDDIGYKVLVFNSGKQEYTNYETGVDGYTNGTYAPDAVYLGTVGNYYIFKQSGVIGKISTSCATVIDYDEFVSKNYITSTYTCTDGRIYHNITTNLTSYASTQLVGFQQEYMEDGISYYSYDGHYFYTSYTDLVDDYVAGTTTKAINPEDPYYSYYQYLSFRTETNFTTEQIYAYISSKTSSSSVLDEATITDFVTAEATYGVNSILALGVCINETSWGTSSIATSKNNLFGAAAYDSSTKSAMTFDSVTDSINYFAYNFMSQGYLRSDDYRYFGPCLGDKESGANVKYASDPYWGEKAAANCYFMEIYNSEEVYDYNSTTIGITNEITKVYSSADTSSSLLYDTSNYNGKDNLVTSFPFVILEEVTGETIDGSNVWYKVQTDITLKTDRTGRDVKTTIFDFDRDYGYIHSSVIDYISDGEIETVTYLTGDVNCNGTIEAADYMLIKNHIMGKTVLSGTYLSQADVNKSGTIEAADYMLIKNHIMGKTVLE